MHYSFGLGASSLDHRRREEFPAIFTIKVRFARSVNSIGDYGMDILNFEKEHVKEATALLLQTIMMNDNL